MKYVMFLLCGCWAGCGFAAEHVVANNQELGAKLPQLKDGDTLRIKPGDYHGGWAVAKVKNLTVTAYDEKKPPVFRGMNQAWHFSRCENLKVSHLVITGQKHNGINIDDGGNQYEPLSGVELTHLDVSDIGPKGNFDGIKLSGLVKWKVENCKVAGWGGTGD